MVQTRRKNASTLRRRRKIRKGGNLRKKTGAVETALTPLVLWAATHMSSKRKTRKTRKSKRRN